jgi:hypothetical protein
MSMHEVFRYYTRVQHGTGDRPTIDLSTDVEAMIDPIDKTIVGKLDVCQLVKRAPPFAAEALQLVLPNGHWEARLPVWADTETREATLHRRGKAKRPVPPAESRAVLHLEKESGLYAPFNPLKAETFAGAFFVWKVVNKTLRVITDAREGNAWMDASGDSFTLFSLESLIQVLSNLRAYDRYYAVSTDLRHWFHQIPLPVRLRPYFVLELQKNKGRCFRVPVAVPMGWLLAPLVGQSATWSMLLASSKTETSCDSSEWLEKYDVDGEYVRRLTSAPAWLPLRSGGGIFVILDNILVVTPNQRVAELWQRRITDITNEVHAVLKTPPEFVELTAEGGHFEFLGIEWRHHHRRIKLDDDEESMPGLSADGLSWAGTHRALAQVLGKLLWHHRVHGTDRRSNAMAMLRQVYYVVTPPSGHWNDDATNLVSPPQVRALAEQWSERGRRQWAESRLYLQPSRPSFVAVDASTTLKKIGIVMYNPSGVQPPCTKADVTVEICTHEHGDNIALAELQGIRLGVEFTLRHQPRSDLVVVATDSLNAKCWVEQGYSTTSKGDEMIGRIFKALGARRLYLVYVPTGCNVADEPSRQNTPGRLDGERQRHVIDTSNSLIVDEKVRQTWARLELGRSEAMGAWQLDGPQIGGAPAIRTREIEE